MKDNLIRLLNGADTYLVAISIAGLVTLSGGAFASDATMVKIVRRFIGTASIVCLGAWFISDMNLDAKVHQLILLLLALFAEAVVNLVQYLNALAKDNPRKITEILISLIKRR